MFDRSDLWRAGNDALQEIGLNKWKIWYADEEPETIIDHQAAPNSAFNIRFNLVTDDGRFLNLRLRLPGEKVAEASAMRDWLRAALITRVRQDHL
jgi:hypothetical protein